MDPPQHKGRHVIRPSPASLRPIHSHLSNNRLTYVREGVLQRAQSLERLELGGNPITTVDHGAFSSLPRLKEL